ncbi:MAG: glycosyltransferase [Alphaproteobacteria bacterium]|nr:glycosyltransferase [Alphaproteobacteria bacterium]
MKISVITVCRNSQATIAYTIESFLLQDYADKELVVVDGVSTDRTLAIVETFKSDLIRVKSEPDRGIYDAMNKGLGRYQGDAVGFLHSDDTFHDAHALDRLAEGLATADVVFGDLQMVEDHQAKTAVRTWEPGGFSRIGVHLGWVPPHPTFYARRKVFDAFGVFNTKYTIAADYEFMLWALMKHRCSWRYIPATLVDFQIGGTSTRGFKASLTANLECLDVRRRLFGWVPVDLAFFGRPIRRLNQLNWRRPVPS